jgi:hypothetical protein
MRVLTPARWYPLERDGDLGEVTDISYYRDGPAATPAGTQDGSVRLRGNRVAAGGDQG